MNIGENAIYISSEGNPLTPISKDELYFLLSENHIKGIGETESILSSRMTNASEGTSLARFCEKNNISSNALKKHLPKETERLVQLYQIHKENISHQRQSSLRDVPDFNMLSILL